MSKLSYEDKIKMYEEYKKGIGYVKLAKKYNIGKVVAEYLLYLIDKNGYDILRKNKNRTVSSFEYIKWYFKWKRNRRVIY